VWLSAPRQPHKLFYVGQHQNLVPGKTGQLGNNQTFTRSVKGAFILQDLILQ